MAKYLAPIDLEDDELSIDIIEKAVEMATGVKGAKLYLMTVIPGIFAGIDQTTLSLETRINLTFSPVLSLPSSEP